MCDKMSEDAPLENFDMPTESNWTIKKDTQRILNMFKETIDHYPEGCTITRNAQKFVGMIAEMYRRWGLIE